MLTRKWCILLFSLVMPLFFDVAPAHAARPLNQTIQITTHFRTITGNPVWLLILRDADSGVVMPYLYDVKNEDNFWLALSFGRNYIITASTLKFGPFAVIHNFCHLEDGVLAGKSMTVTLTGDLTPVSITSRCRVLKYNDNAFTIST
ncbi:MAG TPA: hypothetical protein VLJ15_01950 [Gammaproteobacteria bacterium]|nr:hypothetical protein [Gammaproteobacteria bacterium]